MFGPAASLLSDTTAPGPSQCLALQLPCCQTLQHQVPVSVRPCSFPAVRHYSTRSQSVFGPAASLLSDTTAPGPSQSSPAASLLLDTTAPGPSQSLALQLTCCQTLQHQVPVSLWPCSFPAVRHYSTRSQSVLGPAAYLLSDTTAPGPSQCLALQLPCCQTLQHQVPVSVWPCSFPAVRHYSTRSQSVFGPAASLLSDTTAPGPSVWPCSFPAVRHYSTRSQSVFGPAASLLSDTTAPGPSQC